MTDVQTKTFRIHLTGMGFAEKVDLEATEVEVEGEALHVWNGKSIVAKFAAGFWAWVETVQEDKPDAAGFITTKVRHSLDEVPVLIHFDLSAEEIGANPADKVLLAVEPHYLTTVDGNELGRWVPADADAAA